MPESSRKSSDSGVGLTNLYKELSKQAKAVFTLIDKELPNLVRLYEPMGDLYAAYQQVTETHDAYMSQWVGHLADSDLNGRARELALTEIERSFR